jgi:hypothetical protein
LGVKAPSSQSFTRLRTLQKLGLGDFDFALLPRIMGTTGLFARRGIPLALRSFVVGESRRGTVRFRLILLPAAAAAISELLLLL